MNMHVGATVMKVASKFKVGDRVRRINCDNNPTMVVGWTGVVKGFKLLYGDEYLDFGGGVDGNAVNFEPAPLFAVGDKVRVVKSGRGHDASFHGAEVGDVLTVTTVGDGAVNAGRWAFYFHEIELIPPAYTSCAAAEVDNLADEYGAPKTASKVRCLVDQFDVTKGKIYEVDEVDGKSVWIIDDVGDTFYLTSSEFEHVAVAPATALRIEAGKFYKTRDGRRVGPYSHAFSDIWRVGGDHSTAVFEDGTTSRTGRKSDNDLIAEWTDEPVADRVPGYRFTSKNPPKMGDRVRIGDQGTFAVKEVKSNGNICFSDRPRDMTWLLHKSEGASDCTLVAPAGAPTSIADIVARHSASGTAIVCLLENGKPAPATQPFVHGTAELATKEATRLANVHRGKEFGVYTLGAVAKVERVYEHEWQRLAAGGQVIAAIKELRRITGMGLATAKDAVEDWLGREAESERRATSPLF
ncbi:ribosomal protein L7/L12 [Mesorhizobium sp. BR1-1-13]|uniref:ribosomal protein L7/L12 n=1 Tax=Mesorhizobium sp. BR1-1-13 TaxID=2876656 RepID=UPI001CD18D41|nr:ribosomal protein L7/L12 [Mesorhizobium sp. BR1-1-13]MBZ9943481.1 ribosomal protein L7/L12 [Mesorhizobium sp. BR1-1-13]